jgi:ammonium transporter Rh
MIFVGFGFLMTFLKRYAHSAVALNFVASCLVILEAVLVIGWAQQGLGIVSIDLPLLIDAAFAAGAAMISFGAVLGKATPAQLLWLLALQVPLYAATAQLVAGRWGVLDVGGSLTIHAFGAFYGLAASYWLSPPGAGAAHPKNGASPASDLTAMIGTVFLFIYWPSFNGALASAPGAASQPQVYCIMNSVVALLGACLAAFAASAALEGRLDMVHVQNATLAGGVAIGSSASLRIDPAAALAGAEELELVGRTRTEQSKNNTAFSFLFRGSMDQAGQLGGNTAVAVVGDCLTTSSLFCPPPDGAVGIVAGCLSTLGYVLASPWVERRLGVTDTCGVLNLHGCPGILGGLASALFAAVYGPANAALLAHGAAQPLWQLAGLGACLGAAAGGGLAAGWVVSRVDPFKQALKEEELFEDGAFWKEEHED